MTTENAEFKEKVRYIHRLAGYCQELLGEPKQKADALGRIVLHYGNTTVLLAVASSIYEDESFLAVENVDGSFRWGSVSLQTIRLNDVEGDRLFAQNMLKELDLI